MASRLVGVIDLKGGVAVHGVAGRRANYAPVRTSKFRPGASDGNPGDLLSHYQNLGLKRFYLADLDSLEGSSVQGLCIESLVNQSGHDTHWTIDAGLRDPDDRSITEWIDQFTETTSPSLGWVVASETAINIDTAANFAHVLQPTRLILGIDFCGGKFVGPSPVSQPSKQTGTGDLTPLSHRQSEWPLQEWIRLSADAGIRSALILDVAAVGTAQGPVSLSNCRRFRQKHGDWQIISGGGCRGPADAQAFFDAGCDDCMVATALHC